jgi:hypothetical protein
LVLYPSQLDDPFQGSLEISDIQTIEKYEPPSYVWGNPNRCHEITCDGRSLGLTKSLGGALRRLRRREQPRRLWADQVCIDQDNAKERNHQIQFMNTIYKNADHVVVWLGDDEKNIAERTFLFFHNLDAIFNGEKRRKEFSLKYTEHLTKQSREQLAPLYDLLSLPWVSRILSGSLLPC